MWAAVAIITLWIAGIAPAFSAASPELLNKTIQVRYSSNTPAHRDNGENLLASVNHIRTIYISSAGRAFIRGVDLAGPAQNMGTKERAPGENNVEVRGRKLVQHSRMTSGAVRMEVDVDPTGSSCTATVVVGRDTGRPLRWKGVNGMWATATGPMTVSNVTCSISAGNGVAQ